MKHELISLFCGCGGLDYGFHQAGFKTVLALDNCSDAVRTFNANLNGSAAQQADLSCLSPKELLSKLPPSAHPIGLIGGPPCQGLSQSNVYSTPDDPRNQLLFRFVDLLVGITIQHQLQFFVLENVAGLLQPKYAELFQKLLRSFEAAGFRVFENELNASDFSVPQRRRRLFLVGFNTNLYPNPEFVFPIGKGDKKTVADAIADLPEPALFQRHLTPETIPHHQNHWTMMPKSEKFTSGGVTTGRSFRRIAWDEVSPTVAYGNREVHIHPEGKRRLSVLEAMLLQGFPQCYKLTGTLSAQITQISNAVPPPLAKAVAESIRTLIDTAQLAQTD